MYILLLVHIYYNMLICIQIYILSLSTGITTVTGSYIPSHTSMYTNIYLISQYYHYYCYWFIYTITYFYVYKYISYLSVLSLLLLLVHIYHHILLCIQIYILSLSTIITTVTGSQIPSHTSMYTNIYLISQYCHY
jgi:hypothetical protein